MWAQIKRRRQSFAGIRADIVRGGGGQDNLGCPGEDSAVCTPPSTLRDAAFYTHTLTHSQYTAHLPHPCWEFIVRAPLPGEADGEPLCQPDEGQLCGSVGAGRGAVGPALWDMALIVPGPLFSRTCTAAHDV